MWYKNKVTGLVWNVTDKELIDRLEKDSDYEAAKAPQEKKQAKTSPASQDETKVEE